jgi:hypothetical protein
MNYQMKHLFILLLCCIFIFQDIQAQHLSCGTPAPTAEQKEFLRRLGKLTPTNKSRVEKTEGVSTYFPLAIYILRKSNGSNGVNELELMKGIADMNRQFKSMDVQFYICGGFNYVDSDTYSDFKSADEGALVGAGHFQSGKINVYYANTVTSGSTNVGGYAWLPGGPERMFIKNSQCNDGKTVPHEMGHYFGLLHTFESSNNATVSERELVTRGAGANCTTKGDDVCDTPADPYDQPNGNILTSCVYTGGNVDANGDPYTPMTSNIMGYYFNCGNDFTTGQYTRMQGFAAGTRNYNSATCSATIPTAPTLSSLTMVATGVNVVWTDVANEIGYLIERSIDNINFTSVGAVSADVTNFIDTSASSNTLYYYRVKPINAPASFSNVLSITTGLIYCIPTYAGTCSATGNVNDFIFSQGATNLINDLNTGCSPSSYGDFTATIANVSKGTTYDFTLRLLNNTCIGSFSPRNLGIWVDYNQNGVFEAGEKVVNDNTSNICFTGSFTIPATASSGNTRMRVRLRNRGAGDVDDACANYSFGEVHDYTLNISGGNDNTSRVEAPAAQVATANINIGTADANVFRFKINDLGTADGVPTNVTQVIIRQGIGNTVASWAGKITTAKLFDGVTQITATPTVNATDITFAITGTNLPIANNSNKDITLAITLAGSGFNEGDKLAFQVLGSAHGFTAAPSGSSEFASTFPAAVVGNVMNVIIPPQAGDIVINEFVTEPKSDWSTNAFNGIVGAGAVNVTDEWIELYIKRAGMNLTGWTIEMNDATPASGSLAAGGAYQTSNYISSTGGMFTNTKIGDYLVIGNPTGVASMNNSAMNIVLKDPSGTVIDQVAVGINASSAGGAAGSGSTGTADEVMARVPNGAKTGNDNTDFKKQTATMGKINTPDLIVTTSVTLNGSYNNVTIKNTGALNLNGTINAEGNFLIETGGQLLVNCNIITGTGNFTMQSGTTLEICDENGITPTGATGTVRVTGARNYAGDATYIYKPVKINSQTGNGLPSVVTNLIIDAREAGVQGSMGAGNVILSSPTVVTRLVELRNGNLTSNGKLTLESTASRTAMVIQRVDASNSIIGDVTVNRHITGGQAIFPAAYAGVGGYHYFSPPISNATVGQLSEVGLVLNSAYDWVTPYSGAFPNFFRYVENRVQASAPNDVFEKGWESPASTSEALSVARGFIMNVSQGTTIDYVGTLNNGTVAPITLTRGASTNSGWHLMGNPYPAPISWTNVVGLNAQIDGAVLRRIPTGQYAGTFASFVGGVGTNGGADEIAIGQGFFVRANVNNANFTMNNSVRLTAFNNPTFFRTEETESAKKEGLIKLQVSQDNKVDEMAVYFEDGATESFDFQYDAERMQYNSGGMPTLFTSSKDSKNLSINGLPAFREDFKIPMTLYTYTNGKYTFKLNELKFFKNTTQVFIEDKLLGIVHNIRLDGDYTFEVPNVGFIKDRFVLRFTDKTDENGKLASLSAYPNPSNNEVNLRFFNDYKGGVAIYIYDLTGKLRRIQSIDKTTSLFEVSLDLQGLESGMYIIETIDNQGNKEQKRIAKL